MGGNYTKIAGEGITEIARNNYRVDAFGSIMNYGAGGIHQNGTEGGVVNGKNEQIDTLMVTKVEGPFDEEGNLVDFVSKGTYYSYRAITNKKMKTDKVNLIKWARAYDDSDLKIIHTGGSLLDDTTIGVRFRVGTETTAQKLTLYAFFTSRDNNAKVEVTISEEEYYRFNPLSNKGGEFSKRLNSVYVNREGWNAMSPVIESGRSFDPYVLVEKEEAQDEKDNIGTAVLQETLFGIAIHHSGNSGLDTMSKIQDDHINGNNKRADIGYHFGIDLSGKVYEGRYIGVKGSHLTQYNTGIVGIVFLADFDHSYWWDFNGDDEMSHVALKALFLLINALKEQFPGIETLGAHKEWKNNTDRRCPGDYGLKYVKAVRKVSGMKSPKESGHGQS